MKTAHLIGLASASSLSGPLVLERKDGEGDGGDTVNLAELKTAIENLGKTQATFHGKVDKELEEIKKSRPNGSGGEADAVTKDEVKKLNDALDEAKKRLDEFELKANRPALVGPDGQPLREPTEEQKKHSAAFGMYFRRGVANEDLEDLNKKALQAGADPEGGYLVPTEIETAIDTRLRESSPVRGIATVRQTSFSSFKKPINLGGAESGWVGETSPRPETDTPTLAEMGFDVHELYANPAATQTILDDAAVNVEQWLSNEVEDSFTRQENAAFVNGDGVSKPRGFLGGYPLVANGQWAWGRIGYFNTGVAGDFQTANPGDEQDVLIDTIFSLDERYRQNARWIFNKFTQARLRKVRDADGNPVWSAGMAAGTPAALMGYPITELGGMPNIAANAPAMAFGDFRRGYLIVDRIGIRVLRDPYTNKPYVHFYTTKRVGGGVQDFEAIKLIRFAA